MKYPSFRSLPDVLFLVCCVVLSIWVLVPELFGSGKGKDYPLWYLVGQQVVQGGDIYRLEANGTLDFIYPPFAAILFAILGYFGKIPLILALCLLNAAAWWITGQLSNAMTGSDERPSPWLAALPGIATISSVYDQFHLGQPNLILLALMLIGFWVINERPWVAGSMFALATAIKVFPVAVLPYLLWRRRWASAASMIAFLIIFVFVLPAPIRGFERNVAEVTTWYNGMIRSSSEQGFGQRDEQNWSWINQSIIAVGHRLLRPINYEQDRPDLPAQYVNVLNLDFKTANMVLVGVSVLIGLWFVWLMPPRSQVTPRSNAEELGILFCLITVASPLARQYYFMWLYFPITVLIHRAAFDPRPSVQKATWTLLGVVAFLMALSLPVFPHLIQALGNNLVATAILVGGLAWHMRNAPRFPKFSVSN